jgi:hypothetical protein
MVQHAGGKSGLFQLAVAKAERADPAQIGFERPDRPAAEHDAGVRSVVGDSVVDLARRLGGGIDAFDARVQDFQRRHHEIGRIQHVEHGAIRSRQTLGHHEGKLRFDACRNEAA